MISDCPSLAVINFNVEGTRILGLDSLLPTNFESERGDVRERPVLIVSESDDVDEGVPDLRFVDP